MDWVVISSDDWKPHATPDVFADALVAEMHARGVKGEISRRPISTYGLDRGGMCYVRRPLEEFSFGGLQLKVPSEYVSHFYDRLAELSPRKFGQQTYYKLHCSWSCIVLTPVLRRRLLRALRCRIDKAEAKATAFYAGKKSLNSVLAEVAAQVMGEEIAPEMLGQDPHARFRKKARA